MPVNKFSRLGKNTLSRRIRLFIAEESIRVLPRSHSKINIAAPDISGSLIITLTENLRARGLYVCDPYLVDHQIGVQITFTIYNPTGSNVEIKKGDALCVLIPKVV